MSRSRKAHWILPLVVLTSVSFLGSAAVWAQDGGGVDELGSGDRPWADGVSIEQQSKARELFQEANALLLQQFFKQSADKYRDALDYWDHPAIHYNISLALLNLDKPLELYHHLGKSIEHGVPPLLAEANYQRAENYLAIASKQIATVEIACSEPEAKVTFDGKVLFTGPGAWKGPTLAGEHTVIATKKGYLAENKSLVLKAGKQTRVEMRLYTNADLITETRRFPRWLPWTITAAGAAVALAGGALHFDSKNGFQDYDTQFGLDCPGGCNDPEVPGLTDQLNGATWKQRFGISAYFLGGTAFATGLVMVFLNQPKITRKERPDANDGITITHVAPMVTPGGSGVTAGFRF